MSKTTTEGNQMRISEDQLDRFEAITDRLDTRDIAPILAGRHEIDVEDAWDRFESLDAVAAETFLRRLEAIR